MSYQIVEIRIPRLRGQGFVPNFLEPNHRAFGEVEGWVSKAFLSGFISVGGDTASGVYNRLQAIR